MATRKRQLFSGLDGGIIVEIGPGTGPNLRYLTKEARWIGIERNEYTFPYLRDEASRLGMRNIEIRKSDASTLPFWDNSVDVVIGTLALCTVPNLETTLAEIFRVLKPGGRFIFLEHAAAPKGTFRRKIQSLAKPVWKVLTDGCHPDRETLAAIKNTGFSRVESENFMVLNSFVSPHLAGAAWK